MKARRGDVVAIVTADRTFVIGAPSVDSVRVALAIVTSITRDGVVKLATHADGMGTAYSAAHSRADVLVVPDLTPAWLDAYRARRYPTAPHSTMVPPFDSIEAARTFLAPFRA